MKTIARWYDGLPQHHRLILSSLVTSGGFVGGIIISAWMKALLTGDITTLLLLAVMFLVGATVVYLFKNAFVLAQEQLHAQAEAEQQLIVQAHYHRAAVLIDEIRRIDSESVLAQEREFCGAFLTSVEKIRAIVEATFKAFETVYGRASAPDKRIDFEATFMTKSYRDGKITIPACANRDGRDPRSMVLRKSEPDIYEGTETAKIYAAARPYCRIVENTNASVGYKQLYEGEKNRICSSIITPVLSDKNELLGTLVVHCDSPGFFRECKAKYWGDVMEIFTRSIALEKLKLDKLVMSTERPLAVALPIEKPF